MSAKSANLIVSLLLTIMLGCNSLTPGIKNEPSNDNSKPVKSMKITVGVNHLEEFRAQLREFTDKHSLTFTEAFYNGDHTHFAVFMETDDFHIVLGNNMDSPGEFSLGIFNEAIPPIPQQTIDELTNDLKSFIMKIPNVAIAEKIKSLIITIDKNREGEVLDQLQKFADKHSLEFKLSFSSDKSLFHVEIYSDGFHIISEDRLRVNDQDVEDIFMTFYTDINNKTPNITPILQETLDELFNDLKNFLNEIPNVTIIEAK